MVIYQNKNYPSSKTLSFFRKKEYTKQRVCYNKAIKERCQ